MSKIQAIVLAILMTTLINLGMEGDGYLHKSALFVAGWMAGYLMLAALMEWNEVES